MTAIKPTEPSDQSAHRTALARDRTVLASERTYATWVRTGLTALASGIGAKALLNGLVTPVLVSITSTVLLIFAMFCFAAGVWREVSGVLPAVHAGGRIRCIPGLLLVAFNAFLIGLSFLVMADLLHR